MNKLTTIAAVREALKTEGARLVQCESFASPFKFYVEEANGVRTPCTKVADRLTYGPKKLAFQGRTTLELFYA